MNRVWQSIAVASRRSLIRSVSTNAYRGRTIRKVAIFAGSGLALGLVSAGAYSIYQTLYPPLDIKNKLELLEPLPYSALYNEEALKKLQTHGAAPIQIYQFQSCPFCCKVRAYMDYYGLPYSTVEVNSISRKQLKWSSYGRVPTLTISNNTVLFDSSQIISCLQSMLFYKLPPSMIATVYPIYDEANDGRQKNLSMPSKYNVMMGDLSNSLSKHDYEGLAEEKKWRRWVDDEFIHVISPNLYRTPSEAVRTFHWFSEHGQWQSSFSWFERQTMIYLGAAVMLWVGRRLKKKYRLKEDVRQSLYDELNRWGVALRNKNAAFMGGSEPNLADLSLYGTLTAFEGCAAFADSMQHTVPAVRRWHDSMRQKVNAHAGRSLLRPHNMHQSVAEAMRPVFGGDVTGRSA